MIDNEFDDFLKRSSPPLVVPFTFRQSVWHRIEVAAPIPRLVMFLAKLTQPLGAGILAAAALVIGVLLGNSMPGTEDRAQIDYIESVSPFAHQKP
ncbi:MAG: hypothetical protein KF712_21345 [Akkermansiaceae bacterium]|nr:hypothetical protein [Akkermansiaceae bacterium]